MTPLLSIVIPTRANNLEQLQKILDMLQMQTFSNFELIFVCDRAFTPEEWEKFEFSLSQYKEKSQITFPLQLISNQNTDFSPQSKGGASYVRNCGIKTAKGKYLQLFDDDNVFDPDYLEKAFALHKKYKKQYNKEVFITPSLMWRNTDIIQNQGFSGYTYWFARPIIHFLKEGQAYAEIKMFSGNGIFGKTEIMQNTLYDEAIAWIAEDLDFVYSIWKQGFPILVFRDLKVRHQERDKTDLEHSWIGNKASAHQKIKNLFLWVKKHGSLFQKSIFLLRSSWGISLWLSIKALRLGKGKEKREIIRGIWSGYAEGRKHFLRK